MSELILMCGIPASGKSTMIKQEVEKLHSNYRIISRDAIRFSMVSSDEDYFSRETEVFDRFIKQINNALSFEIEHIYVDATHVSKGSRHKVLSKLTIPPGVNLRVVVMTIPVHVALNRNANRQGRARVPDIAVRRMFKGFEMPQLDEFEEYGFNKVSIVKKG